MNNRTVHARCARAALTALMLSALFCQACATLRVPELVPESAAQGSPEVTGSLGTVSVSARPILRLDEYRDLFDEDLPKIGLAALVVTVRNSGPGDYEVGRLRLQLLSPAGRSAKALDAEGVMKAYYKGRGTRTYSVRSHEAATAALERVLLRRTLLGAGGDASGLMFFRISPAPANRWASGYRLVVRGLPKLGHRDSLDLVLDNAGH